MTIPQWTVRGPHRWDRTQTFESEGQAFARAADLASATMPAVVTIPRGDRYLVLKVDEFTEVTTRAAGASVRQVVEL